MEIFQAFLVGGRYHIETSPLICQANQRTGLYMMSASNTKGLKRVFFQPQKKFVVGQRKAIGDNRHGGGIIPLMMKPKREDYRKFE